MARPLRIEYPGAWYHVMNRVAGRGLVFKERWTTDLFLRMLQEMDQRFDVGCHAYCLMGNHYHLMLRTPEGNLGRLMRHLNGLYTQWHNRHARQDGPLFRGRYKAVLVEADVYWTHLSRYIHRDPRDAGMVRTLSAYPWSSYTAYVGESRPPAWLYTRYILGALGGRAAYRRFVEQGETNPEISAFYSNERHPAVLGSKRYLERIGKGLKPHQDIPEIKPLQARPGLSHILKSVARYYGVPELSLRTATRGRGVKSPARGMAMYLCQHSAGMRLGDIAATFNLGGYASAGAAIRNVRVRLEDGGNVLRKDLNYILQDLTP